MKKAVLISILIVLSKLAFSQVPESFNYQVIVRDASGNPLQKQNVSFQFNIIKGSIVKTTVFTEKQSAVTNSLGLVNLAIGNGTDPTGSIVTIDWGADVYSLKVEIDPTGGSAYTEMGTTQLLSVPYARHSRFADTAYTHFEADPVFIIHPSFGISTGNIEDWTEAYNWGNHALMGYVPGTRTITINGTAYDLTADRNWSVGTVTSVDLSMPGIFSVSDSPVTGSGTLSAELVSQSANLVFAAPSGSAAAPLFRTLDATDIPGLDWSKITTGKPTTLEGYGITDAFNGTWSSLTGKPSGNNIGDMLYWNGTTWVLVPIGQPGQFLLIDNETGIPSWSLPNPIINSTASLITYTTVVSGGNVISDYGSDITDRGVCWSTSPNPTIADNKLNLGSGMGEFTSIITGLFPFTTYYLKAFATNRFGTGYGNEVSFTTQKFGIVTDADGNSYNTFVMGTQTWMAENLKTTKYSDGTSIPPISDDTEWSNLTTPGLCWYNNDEDTYKATYGALYNWYAISSTTNGGKNICPTGWHLPSDAEWTTLTMTYLGGEVVAGGKLKEADITHWSSPNTGATNETGFTALPGGRRFTSDSGAAFLYVGYCGYWWWNVQVSTTNAMVYEMTFDSRTVMRGSFSKKQGLSVRCIKD